MRNAGLEKAQAGIKIAGRNINIHTSPDSHSMFQRLRKGRERRVEKVSERGMMYTRMRQSLVHWKLYDTVERNWRRHR